MDDQLHVLERTVTIRATRDTVLSFFTDSERFATWWGPGSRIEPRPGGEVLIRYPNGVVAGGVVVELDGGRHVVFTFGYDSGKPIATGASTVTVVLDDHTDGTQLTLSHAFADAVARDQHVAGWRFQLSLLADAAARAQHAAVEPLVDRYFAAWSEREPERRVVELRAIALAGVTFRDRWAALAGIDELVAHVGATQQHMPAVVLLRDGPVRHCQGTVLADWIARSADGATVARGTNVFELAPDGRLARIVGLW